MVRENPSDSSKFIVFGLDGESYCLPILCAQEIISDYALTRLPELPDLYHGVISLRGDAILVINLRRRFGLPEHQRDHSSRIIILDLTAQAVGVLVDEVHRVVTVKERDIETPPSPAGGGATYIRGVSELSPGRFTMFLDMEAILSSDEKIALAEIRDSIVEGLSSTESRVHT